MNSISLNKITFHDFKAPFLLKLIVFWLTNFALFRLFFILYTNYGSPEGRATDVALSFLYGLRLDISVACMFAIIPFILQSFQQFLMLRFIKRVNNFYHYFLIIIVSILSISNIKIFGEWGTLLNSRALKYMLYPKEALSFISFWPLFFLLSSCVFFSLIGIRLYNKFLKNYFVPEKKSVIASIVFILATPILLIVGIRGGLQLAPINESSSYYSSNQTNNLIATNNIWYLGHSILEASDEQNPYVFMDAEKAKKITADLFKVPANESQNILKIQNPNIVFIVLESWTADIIEQLGGDKNITPHFNELINDGILFTQMYGSGFRTEQGLVSIFSGFPSQPNNSIITTPSKAEKLPSLTKDLAKQNYSLSFYYGGEVEFANMKSYLLRSGFSKIIDKSDFSKDQLNSKWGAHDEYVLNKQIEDLKNEKEPFCSVLLTLSSHEPFEVPMETPYNGSEESERFKKAAYYSDFCLFKYFETAKKQPWYKNTLFILVADHGHRLPKNRDMNLPEGRKITALITGGALIDSLRGSKIDKICNQHDFATTILSQMKINHSDFMWSNDLFNPKSQDFAYYANENVLGWITPRQTFIYSFATKSPYQSSIPSTSKNDTIELQAKAYLQTLYQQYLDY